MQPRHHAILAATLVALLAATAGLARAAEDAAGPMALQRIMQSLGQQMQRIAGAMAREDWVAATAAATAIAAHPQPPLAEKMRILAFIGADANRFRDHDVRTRAAARALQQASMRADGERAIQAYADLQRSCLACHQQFRTPFVERFHARR